MPVYVLGMDIGGANIKIVSMKIKGREKPEICSILREYFPLWIHGKKGLENKLKELKKRLVTQGMKYAISACMTAELCDVYRVKREGVLHVANSLKKTFDDALEMYFVSVDRRLIEYEEVLKEPLKVAAANWAASAYYLERVVAVEKGLKNCIFIDIGSTTTTIIPIVEGRADIRGLNDPEKLTWGELVYLGALRSNVVAIVDKVPYKGLFARVSTEKFSLSGDVHLVLGKITSEEYTTETADGRGVSIREAMERLARVPCADAELLNEYEIKEIARYVYEVEVFKVFEALVQIRSRIASKGINPDEFTVISAGSGDFLIKEAARRAGFKRIIHIDDLVGERVASIFPAYASAIMYVKERYS
ncbi:MAG: hypothetical protein DRN15_05345 [Thermoprotei archaeon]|nr:MAG: hypothetical protein DRM97_06585 [Thermoprotei archaeon]RLF23740.1 MAG: hypothetical protein DRN15_05345 [Thermoprotei archaeon]